MTVEAALLDLMRETCVVYDPVTSSSTQAGSFYAVTAFATIGREYRCRWQELRDEFRTETNETVAQRGVLWVSSTGRISPRAKVVLADGSTPPILASDSYPDETGRVHHCRLRLGFSERSDR